MSNVTGTNLISEGETSEHFFFFTSPSSPPVKISCETTEDSIVPKWKNPKTHGMNANDLYKFKWRLSIGLDAGVYNKMSVIKESSFSLSSIICITQCSRIDRNPSFIPQDFFHFSKFIDNGDNLNM